MTYSEFGKRLYNFCQDHEDCDFCEFHDNDKNECLFRHICDGLAPYELVVDLKATTEKPLVETHEHGEICELKEVEPGMTINAKNVYISFNEIERTAEK